MLSCMRRSGFQVSALIAGLLLSSLSATAAPAGKKKKVSRIAIEPVALTLEVGGSRQFIARGYDAKNRLVRGVRFTWSTSEQAVATVSSVGVVQAAGVGSTEVSARAQKVTGSATLVVSDGSTAGLTNLFFLHHSTGNGFVVEGDMRGYISGYNSSYGTGYQFWDHGYNGDGLRDPSGNSTGTSYNIPDDNTDPDGLWKLWTSSASDAVQSRNTIVSNHEVIAFKSCFPASAISDAATLNQYKQWYLDMRDFFDSRPDRVFVVMSTPPLHPLSTNQTEAQNARAFANWLKSSTYLTGHPNVVSFDLFDILANPDDGSATANMLRAAYQQDPSDGDSHPNAVGNQTVGPQLAQVLINAALSR